MVGWRSAPTTNRPAALEVDGVAVEEAEDGGGRGRGVEAAGVGAVDVLGGRDRAEVEVVGQGGLDEDPVDPVWSAARGRDGSGRASSWVVGRGQVDGDGGDAGLGRRRPLVPGEGVASRVVADDDGGQADGGGALGGGGLDPQGGDHLRPQADPVDGDRQRAAAEAVEAGGVGDGDADGVDQAEAGAVAHQDAVGGQAGAEVAGGGDEDPRGVGGVDGRSRRRRRRAARSAPQVGDRRPARRGGRPGRGGRGRGRRPGRSPTSSGWRRRRRSAGVGRRGR